MVEINLYYIRGNYFNESLINKDFFGLFLEIKPSKETIIIELEFCFISQAWNTIELTIFGRKYRISFLE